MQGWVRRLAPDPVSDEPGAGRRRGPDESARTEVDHMAPARLIPNVDLVAGLERHGLVEITVAEHGLCIEQGLSPKTTCFVHSVYGAARATLGKTSFGREGRRDLAGWWDLCFAEGAGDLHCFAHFAREWIHVWHLVPGQCGSSEAMQSMVARRERLLKGKMAGETYVFARRLRGLLQIRVIWMDLHAPRPAMLPIARVGGSRTYWRLE
jgi:hypothetical protein